MHHIATALFDKRYHATSLRLLTDSALYVFELTA